MTWNPRSRWLRTLLGTLSMIVGFIAILMFVILVFVPGCNQTDFAVLCPAPYTDLGMPPQAFAKRDADEFRDRFGAQSFLPILEPGKSTGGSNPVKKASASRKVRFYFVTAMAGQTSDGVVFYRADSGADDIDLGLNDPNGCLPMQALWKYLAELPSDQKKILVIDVASGPIDWRWGQFERPRLGDSFDKGDSLGAAVDALARIPNLAVLTSAAPGETSWTNPILKQSAFSHFLIRGLAGEADGTGGKNKDRRVTLGEVYDFVLTNTNHWVAQSRDPRGQHPQLLISGQSREELLKTVVAEVRGKILPPATDSPKSIDGAQLKKLEDLWAARDEWSKNEAEQWHPLAWRQLLENLRRAEQWWLVGQPDGMTLHLYSAEKTVQLLRTRYEGRNQFVATGLSLRAASGIFAGGELEPPEQHLTKAIETYAPNSIGKSDKDQGVGLRTIAEQQSWHSFRSRLWTGQILGNADRDRRAAEDLLFVGGPTDLESSGKLRQNVGTQFEQHKQITADFSDLLRLHNRLLASLPELAWWAAQRLPDEMISKSARDSNRFRVMTKYAEMIDEDKFRPPTLSQQERVLMGELKDPNDLQAIEVDLILLFEQTRLLGRLLDQEREVPLEAFASSREWRAEADVIKRSLIDPDRGLDAILRRMSHHAEGLVGYVGTDAGTTSAADRGQTQNFYWLRLRNALHWTGLAAKTRHALFTALEESDRTLNANAQKVPVAANAEWNGDDWSRVDGCWHALWSLQTLSLGTAYTAMDQRWVDWKNAWQDSKKQSVRLTELGNSVRKEFRDRQKVAKRTPTESDQLDDALRVFLVAERAARTMHGYDAVLFNLDYDPIRQLREFDLGALCITQAERYMEDFWGNLIGDQPWYVRVVQQCLRAAGRQNDLVSVRALKTARENVERQLELKKSARLKIATVDARVDLSLSNQRQTKVTTAFDEQVPSGYAALWLEEDADAPLKILEFAPAGRQALSLKSPSAELTIRKQRPAPESKCELIHVRPRLLFRARYWSDKDEGILVDPCRPNSINLEYQAPASTGEIAVRGIDRRDTLFILDCSASMNTELSTKDKKGDPLTRFKVARKALSETLKVLRDAPLERNEKEPNVIGLMAYGHRARSRNRDPGQTETNPNWQRPIPQEVMDNWRNDFELLIPPVELVGEQFRRMNAYLDPDNPFDDTPLLQPFGETPLLGSIRSACGYLVSQKRGGVVVAICDGAYNDERSNGPRFKAVEDLFRGHPEISLHLVAFNVDEKAEIATLGKLAERAGGRFHEAPTALALAQAIESVMKPQQFGVARVAEPPWKKDADLGQVIGPLPQGIYQVRFPGLRDFPVTVAGGERLEFDLEIANNQLKHRRPQQKLSRRILGNRPATGNEPTRFGYLKAEYDKTTTRALFQFSLDRDDSAGIVERPKEIRIDVTPSRGRRQFSRSWKLAADQSVPVWQIELRDWPPDAKPDVQAAWKMVRTEPDAQLPLGDLMKATRTPSIEEWPEHTLTITAEQQQGKILVKLQASENTTASVADIRVELGELSRVEARFQPTSFDWTSEFFETERQIIYKFEVGEKFDVASARVAMTSSAALNRDVSQLQSPLSIDKWDKEQ